MEAAQSQRVCGRVVDAAFTGGKVDQQAVAGKQPQLFLSQDGRRDSIEDELLLRQQGVHLRKGKGGQPKAARQRQVLWTAGADGELCAKGCQQPCKRFCAATKAGDQAAAFPQGDGQLTQRKLDGSFGGGDGVEQRHLLLLQIAVQQKGAALGKLVQLVGHPAAEQDCAAAALRKQRQQGRFDQHRKQQEVGLCEQLRITFTGNKTLDSISATAQGIGSCTLAVVGAEDGNGCKRFRIHTGHLHRIGQERAKEQSIL